MKETARADELGKDFSLPQSIIIGDLADKCNKYEADIQQLRQALNAQIKENKAAHGDDAKKVADLTDRCKRLEDENKRLSSELEALMDQDEEEEDAFEDVLEDMAG